MKDKRLDFNKNTSMNLHKKAKRALWREEAILEKYAKSLKELKQHLKGLSKFKNLVEYIKTCSELKHKEKEFQVQKESYNTIKNITKDIETKIKVSKLAMDLQLD